MDHNLRLKTVVETTALKLSDVARRIRNAVDREFGSGPHWITAEISELSVRKGHCYIHLVEKMPGAAAPACEMRGIIWSSKFENLNRKFREGTGSDLAKGHVIMFSSSVKFDVKWGLSLVFDDIEPAFTLGLIEKERAITVAKLKAEGVFDHNRNLKFPHVPQNIALISAKDSRGFEDFSVKLDNNKYGYRYKISLFQSRLQGEAASGELVSALISIFKRIKEFDLVVIVRGGGGSVDLNCFNDLRLSRAVARFPIPVITGIGHTSNINVVDEVAYANRITPTDAADFVLEKTRSFEMKIEFVLKEFLAHANNRIHHENHMLGQVRKGIAGHVNRLIEHNNTGLNSLSRLIYSNASGIIQRGLSGTRLKTDRMCASVLRSVENSRNLISRKAEILSFAVSSIGSDHHTRISRISEMVKVHVINRIKSEGHQLNNQGKKLESLDPRNVLKRGFTITMRNDELMKSSVQSEPGDIIKTIFYDGEIESKIK